MSTQLLNVYAAKLLPEQELFASGHRACQGCAPALVLRYAMKALGPDTIVCNATGCMEIISSSYPETAWGVPWMHVAFENAAAVASGVEASLKVLMRKGRIPQRRITVLAQGGDGATLDIGLQALSGALERGHNFIYMCYDNEAYMNTGIQRSGATPFGASTTTSPAGRKDFGKHQSRKDLTAIAVAHHVPYVAQAAISHWQDLSDKALKASQQQGPAFLNVLSGCPLGWGHETKDTIEMVRLAVETRYWPLYEVLDGHFRLNYDVRTPVPLEDWLSRQTRFRHLFQTENKEHLRELQALVDLEWEILAERVKAGAQFFKARPELVGGMA